MNTKTGLDRRAAAWLADGPTELSDRVLDAALREVHVTSQRRVRRVPWRFSQMPALSRATGIAAVALVVVVGVGGLIYLNSRAPVGPGGPAASSPTATPTATPVAPPTVAPSPQPTFDPTAWTRYTSVVYGLTMAYPSDWTVSSSATRKWQPGETQFDDPYPWADVITNPVAVDGDQIALFVWQVPAPADADLATWAGLQAGFLAVCEEPSFPPCVIDAGTASSSQFCLGQPQCRPALVVSVGTTEVVPFGFFGDPATGTITVFSLGRPDDFPAAARYGGGMALLKLILAQVDVRAPLPGETPH